MQIEEQNMQQVPVQTAQVPKVPQNDQSSDDISGFDSSDNYMDLNNASQPLPPPVEVKPIYKTQESSSDVPEAFTATIENFSPI